MTERESLCECGHPREPNHLTPGAECSQSGAPGGCGCVTFKPKSSLCEFFHRLETEPVNVDISGYSDEFCEGFLAGQKSIVEEIVAGRVEVPDA